MKPIDVLIRNYKIETKRMSAQSTANRISIYIGLLLGVLLMTFLLDNSLMRIFGKTAPFAVLFLAVAIFGKITPKCMAIVIWLAFLGSLIASYMGVPTPFFHS